MLAYERPGFSEFSSPVSQQGSDKVRNQLAMTSEEMDESIRDPLWSFEGDSGDQVPNWERDAKGRTLQPGMRVRLSERGRLESNYVHSAMFQKIKTLYGIVQSMKQNGEVDVEFEELRSYTPTRLTRTCSHDWLLAEP